MVRVGLGFTLTLTLTLPLTLTPTLPLTLTIPRHLQQPVERGGALGLRQQLRLERSRPALGTLLCVARPLRLRMRLGERGLIRARAGAGVRRGLGLGLGLGLGCAEG